MILLNMAQLMARVMQISADAVVDERNQDASHYLVDVAIEGDLYIEETGQPVTFIPGMTATVDVLSGSGLFLNIYGNLLPELKNWH